MFRPVLFSLLILSMVSATISPACAFIFGKSGDYIEICSGLNLIQIQVDTQELPDVTNDDCAFCFHHIHMVGADNDVFVLDGLSHTQILQGFINETALIAYFQSYHSRAPPVFS